jgi:hypothetical protein
MKTLKRWNYKTHSYDDYKVPEEWYLPLISYDESCYEEEWRRRRAAEAEDGKEKEIV